MASQHAGPRWLLLVLARPLESYERSAERARQGEASVQSSRPEDTNNSPSPGLTDGGAFHCPAVALPMQRGG